MFFVIKIINFHFDLFCLKIAAAKVPVPSVSCTVTGAETGRAFLSWVKVMQLSEVIHIKFCSMALNSNLTYLKAIIIANKLPKYLHQMTPN